MLSNRPAGASWGKPGRILALLFFACLGTSFYDRSTDLAGGIRTFFGDIYSQDFEKSGLGRLVDDWEDVQGREKGYPHYNKVMLFQDNADQHNAHSGTGYLVMRTAGGNTAFQTDAKLLPADPQRSYSLRGWYRTANVRANRVFLSLRWLDETAREVLAEHKSPLMVPAPEWTEIALTVDQISPLARYVQIRLSYVGPDVRGECWFDDVEMASQAKIMVDTHRPGHIYNVNDEKSVTLAVPAFQSPYGLDVTLRDLQGRTVGAPQQFQLQPGQKQTMTLPAMPAGYYELEVQAEIPGGSRSTKRTAILMMDESLAQIGEKDFGVVVNPYLPGYEHSVLYTEMLGSVIVKLVLWDEPTARGSSVTDAEILKLVREFVDKVTLTAVVGRPHARADSNRSAAGSESENPLDVFAQGKAWEPQLKERVTMFGPYIRNWQIVREGDKDVAQHPLADEILSNLNKVIKEGRSATSLGVSVPWGSTTDRLRTPQFFSVDTRPVGRPEELSRLPDLQGRAFHYTMTPKRLESGDRFQAMSDQLADFVQRCIWAKQGGVKQIYWELQGDPLSSLLDSDGIPLPTFLALRTVNQLLSGVQVENKHLFSGSIRDVVFKKDRETIVALWSEQGVVQQDIYFGEDARVIDCFGRITPMAPNAPMEIGPVPIFLVGINTELLDTQRSLRFDMDFLPLQGEATVLKLNFENRFQSNMKDVTINIGKILDRNQKRKDWRVEPIVIPRAEIAPLGKIEESIRFTIPFSESDGDYDVLIHLTFRTDRRYDLKMVRPLRLQSILRIDHRILPGIVLDTRRLHIEITNTHEKPVDIKALVSLPTKPTLEISIAGLAKNGVWNKDFTLPRYDSLRGQKVRIKVYETSGNLFANEEIVLE